MLIRWTDGVAALACGEFVTACERTAAGGDDV